MAMLIALAGDTADPQLRSRRDAAQRLLPDSVVQPMPWGWLLTSGAKPGVVGDSQIVSTLCQDAVIAAARILATGKMAAECGAPWLGWHWDQAGRRLRWALDPMGAQPLFYAHDASGVTVASAMWLLEACDWIDTAIDEDGLNQRMALGYCLADATPCRAIRRLEGGTLLDVASDGSVRVQRYHRWGETPTAAGPVDQQVMRAHEAFLTATQRLAHCDGKATAALSGGLDTRAVIGALMAQGRQVRALTFSWPSSLEGALAGQFARAAKMEHVVHQVGRPLDEPFLVKSARVLRELSPPASLLWTGFGGSIGAGYVHSNDALVARLRAGNWHGAAAQLLAAKEAAVTRALYGRKRGEQLHRRLVSQVADAVAAEDCDDPGRKVQLYLLRHQEPAQLRCWWENRDWMRMGLAVPFYDPQLLACWLAMPLAEVQYHRAYVRWLDHLPPCVTAVPWQAYPGHVPSPLPLPVAVDQWSDNDQTYFANLARQDEALFQRSGAKAGWRVQAARMRIRTGQPRASYLLRLAAVDAAFRQGKGATLLDRFPATR